MLTQADNELLTRIGPTEAMGQLFRRYWIPAALASEVSEVGGKPIRVRLLGEDLILFRDTAGRLGLMGERCPHRGTSLALGANQDSGIRCIYHGYKFDVEGRCVDTPTEPDGSNFAKKIRARAYPAQEKAGFIWAYLGPLDLQPAFPDFEWFALPDENIGAYKVVADCNYAQTLEGAIDSAHAGILHRRGPWGSTAIMDNEDDLHPRLAIEYTKYGMRYGATRTIPDGTEQARVTAVVMPAWTFIPPQPALRVGTSSDVVKAGRRLVNAFIPRDDTSTWHFQVFYEYDRPFDAGFRNVEGGIRLDAAFRKLSNRSNDYLQDRERMKTAAFSGISGILVQDHAVGETQGDVADRTAEHLGTSDIAVIAWRRLMLNAAKALAGGADPPGIGVSYQAVRGETVPCAMGERWQDHLPLVAELAV